MPERARVLSNRASWDVVIEPEHEYRRRVFNVTEEQVYAFMRALVDGGVDDFRVVRHRGTAQDIDPWDYERDGMAPAAGGDYYTTI